MSRPNRNICTCDHCSGRNQVRLIRLVAGIALTLAVLIAAFPGGN